MEFVGQFKKLGEDGNTKDVGYDKSVFVLTIWGKIKQTRLTFSRRSVTVLLILENYQEARVKWTNTHLNKVKLASKNKKEAILRLNKKNFEDEELQHELFLTRRQATKIKNVFANNMSRHIKLSQVQIPKIIKSDGSFGSWLGNLEQKALTNIAILLLRDNLPGLVSKLNLNAINKFEKNK